MTHRDEHLTAERIQAFLDGELSQGEMARVQAHTASCVRCAAEVDGWRLLYDELEDLPALTPSPALRQRVLGALPRRIATGPAFPVGEGGAGEHLAPETFQERLDGTLPPEARARMDAHLEGCGRCGSELAAWRALYAHLETLEDLKPSVGFADRVMAGLRTPVAVGLLGRLLGKRPETGQHLDADAIQDLLDGRLPDRRAAWAERHLAACASCEDRRVQWLQLYSALAGLESLAPSPEFSDRVMERVQPPVPVPAPTPLSTRVREWIRATVPADPGRLVAALARRILPRTRRAWALVVSAAAAPTVALTVLAAYLFSHPVLTPGYLAAYLWWRASDAVTGVFGQGIALARRATEGLQGAALAEALSASAAGLLLTGVLFTALMGLSLLIVYRTLVAPVNGRHARITS